MIQELNYKIIRSFKDFIGGFGFDAFFDGFGTRCFGAAQMLGEVLRDSDHPLGVSPFHEGGPRHLEGLGKKI